ncbi:hypothetical protein B4O85_12820 [Pseudomonas azotoformans]|uniref:Uncharacterized protein n=1 Tax=Pseudomonas azotoformans TaxID=47878 RepID=A0A4Q0HWK7_PSEAZ|nr:hypothetical protein B4O85_12820 [Pseudomonas azotoformans]
MTFFASKLAPTGGDIRLTERHYAEGGIDKISREFGVVLWLAIPSGRTSSTAKSVRMPRKARSSPNGSAN